MTRVFLVLCFAMLSACSTSPVPTKAPSTPSAFLTYPSPDGRLYVKIRYSKKPYTVVIIERESGRAVGVAESSVQLSDGKPLGGEVGVTYSPDLSTIVVHEDFSDASPVPRYILFKRRAGSSGYRASYFAPPTVHAETPGEFEFIYPGIQRVTNESITLDYQNGQTRVIRIAELLQTHIPKGAEEWPPEAFKRYDR